MKKIIKTVSSFTIATIAPFLVVPSQIFSLPVPSYPHIVTIFEDESPAPIEQMEQQSKCVRLAVQKNTRRYSIPASSIIPLSQLHALANGEGQKIAILDSGISINPRLHHVIGAGDYVMGGDGLSDCDGHGTIIANLIAASPSKKDSFSGVAPQAGIISIRVLSNAFGPAHPGTSNNKVWQKNNSLHTLAKAIRHAAAMGATIINMSLTACADATSPPQLKELRDVIWWAAVKKNIVLIAAAGNANEEDCTMNPAYDPGNPVDNRNWSGATSYSLPSYFAPLVLSVGGVTVTGEPYQYSMAGPWVGIAAPANKIVSLDYKGKLINGEVNERKRIISELHGTSFAAAYVSGVAALIRQKYPYLKASQVIARLEKTAHSPAVGLENTLGAGIIDPIQAITATIDEPGELADGHLHHPTKITNTNTLAIIIASAFGIFSAIIFFIIILTNLKRKP